MTFTAKLKRTSHIWHSWRSANRTSGIVGDAVFRLAGAEYVTGELTPGQVESLRHNTAVLLEMVASPPAGLFIKSPGDIVTEDRAEPVETATPDRSTATLTLPVLPPYVDPRSQQNRQHQQHGKRR